MHMCNDPNCNVHHNANTNANAHKCNDPNCNLHHANAPDIDLKKLYDEYKKNKLVAKEENNNSSLKDI